MHFLFLFFEAVTFWDWPVPALGGRLCSPGLYVAAIFKLCSHRSLQAKPVMYKGAAWPIKQQEGYDTSLARPWKIEGRSNC